MKVTLISVTPDAEKLMEYCARVSSPHQEKDDPERKLLKYCYDHKHWSVFEMADMTVEIETSVAVGRQILRHRSFCFQEFSQRYADASELGFEEVRFRTQDLKNRQNSNDTLTDVQKDALNERTRMLLSDVQTHYEILINTGVAKECARMVLPICTTTRMYMKGSVRSWIHYLQVRTDPSTQLEHREVALAILEIFKEQFPAVGALI
jgi:thymidylate synthase (FAD)